MVRNSYAFARNGWEEFARYWGAAVAGEKFRFSDHNENESQTRIFWEFFYLGDNRGVMGGAGVILRGGISRLHQLNSAKQHTNPFCASKSISSCIMLKRSEALPKVKEWYASSSHLPSFFSAFFLFVLFLQVRLAANSFLLLTTPNKDEANFEDKKAVAWPEDIFDAYVAFCRAHNTSRPTMPPWQNFQGHLPARASEPPGPPRQGQEVALLRCRLPTRLSSQRAGLPPSSSTTATHTSAPSTERFARGSGGGRRQPKKRKRDVYVPPITLSGRRATRGRS